MKKAILFLIISSLIILPFANVLAYGTNYRYTGQERDANSNLYYYGQRYYDPSVGRFTQPDPVSKYLTDPQKLNKTTGQDLQKFLENPQALNEYSYTQNNPIRYTDPTGEWWREFFTGKQSVSSLYGEIGEATMYVNPTMSAVIDHPYLSGAAVGILAGLGVVAAGVAAGTAPWQLAAAGSTAIPVATQVAQKISNLNKLDTLEQVPSAAEKLSTVSKQIGVSVDNILKIANKSNAVFTDLREGNAGNVNIFFQSPANAAKLVRITLDPTLSRIISAGTARVNQVQNWISNGDIINLNQK